jgi:hypothetical protein
LEQYLADPNASVGDEASTLEDLMVEIRVAVADAAVAHGLLRRLAALFDRSSVSFDGMRNEVRIHSEWESRSVVDRSYTMLGPAGLGAPSGRAA